MLKTFGIKIKSHCPAPDLEIEVSAFNRNHALCEFRKQYKFTLQEFEDSELLTLIKEID